MLYLGLALIDCSSTAPSRPCSHRSSQDRVVFFLRLLQIHACLLAHSPSTTPRPSLTYLTRKSELSPVNHGEAPNPVRAVSVWSWVVRKRGNALFAHERP